MAVFLKKYCGDPLQQRFEAMFAMGAYLGARAEGSIYVNVKDSELEAGLNATPRQSPNAARSTTSGARISCSSSTAGTPTCRSASLPN